MAESIINSGINYLLDKSGVQQHFDENEVLREAADRGQISNELYNKMGGFNFKQNVPFAGDVGTGLGSFAYNVTQSALGNQPVSEILGDVTRNYMGAAAGLTKEEKDIYDNILSGGGGGGGGERNVNPELLNEFDNITNTGVNQTEGGIMELLKTGGEKFKNAAVPIFKDVAGRTIASQALGKAGVKFNPYFGLAGLLFGGLKGGDLLNQPYRSGVPTVDQFGNLISGADLDRLNALGGYYTDAARDSRRRDQRIAFMEKRKAENKRFSEQNLARLKAQQAREEAARRAAIDRAQQQFYASDDPGRGPQNNPQGGLGRQDYSRAPSSAFADLASELGI